MNAPSALLLWLVAHGCVSEIEPMPYANTVNVFKSACPIPGPVPQAVEPPAPEPRMKPEQPKRTKVTKRTIRRSSACGSRRQVWRTLSNGHRKFRCKR